jgi:phosphatidylserine/phosphatidylglycerophosphate/cardiolipin synthase-like enzyme
MRHRNAIVGTVAVLICFALLAQWLVPRFTGSSVSEDVEECLDGLESPPSVSTGLFVQPDDSYAPIVTEIDRARCEVNVSIYLISDEVVFDALDAAHDRGVRVQVQLEEDPFGGSPGSADETTEILAEDGISWKWTPDAYRFSHAKYMVIDRQVAIVMNQNLTRSAFNSNREFGIVTTDPEIVDEAHQVFRADWNGEPLDAELDVLVTSPENSREEIIGYIARATETIDFYAEVVRDESFIAALLDAERRGVQVRLILNTSSDPLDEEVNEELSAGGVEIRNGGSLYIHAKAMIFDGEVIFVGSQNPTDNSFENNREVGVAIDDPIVLGRSATIFARDWVLGVPVSPKRASPHDISY